METCAALPQRKVIAAAILITLLAVGFAGFVAPSAHAASAPLLTQSASVSCVFAVSPCGTTISLSLTVTQGETIVLWSSYYPHCNTPEAGTPSDSFGDTYSTTGNTGFQFAACIPPGTLALDYQNAYYATAAHSGTDTVYLSYTTAPYEGDMIVDAVSGASGVSYQVALCNGSEASPCMPGGGGSFGVSQFVPPTNSLIIAYGSASSDSTGFDNPLSAGPGYTADQGPVYPGGYMLDSLTEYSASNVPTSAPFDTSTPTDGWGEIVIVLSSASAVTITQTVTLIVTQTVVLQSTTTSYAVVTQTTTVPVTPTATLTTTVTSTPPDIIPGVGNDTLILSIALLIAAIIIAIALARVAGKRA